MYTQISIFGGSENEKIENEKAQRSRDFQKNCKFLFVRKSEGCSNARRYTLMSMNLNRDSLYGIYDKLADTVAAVFIAPNDDYAERQFLMLISSPDASVFSVNPSDFQLVKFSTPDFDVLRSYSDYSESVIDKLRSARLAKFSDNAEVKKDE